MWRDLERLNFFFFFLYKNTHLLSDGVGIQTPGWPKAVSTTPAMAGWSCILFTKGICIIKALGKPKKEIPK